VSGLLVVIPALNEADTVGLVVTAVRTELVGADVLVIDDGSTDATAAIAQAAGASVLQHPFNMGVGAAIRSGIRFAAERGYSQVLQVDADGQHLPSECLRLLARLDGDGAGDGDVPRAPVDLVVGSRFAAGYSRHSAGYEVSWLRRASMRILSRMVSRRAGTTVRDTTSGFRAFGPRSIALFARAYPSAYLSDTVEALLIAAAAGLDIAEEEVRMAERQGGAPSSNRWRSLLHLLRVMLVVALHRVREPLRERAPVSEVRRLMPLDPVVVVPRAPLGPTAATPNAVAPAAPTTDGPTTAAARTEPVR
jgi:glycosyltransferase involved in cell wall biosynthesis